MDGVRSIVVRARGLARLASVGFRRRYDALVELAFWAIAVGVPIAGLVVRSWWWLVVAFVALPTFYLGLSNDWWGTGVGEGWQHAARDATVASVLATVAAIGLGRAATRSPRKL
jgi:hypothetical protein